MFINNKYTKWYYGIIEKARSRNLLHGIEKHHIIPRELGGSDDPKNIVNLTYYEHALCHVLLTKMLTGNNKYKMVSF